MGKFITRECGGCRFRPSAECGMVGPQDDPCEICQANQPAKRSSKRPVPKDNGTPRPMGKAWLVPRLPSVADYRKAIRQRFLERGGVRVPVMVQARVVNAADGVKCPNGLDDEVVSISEGEVQFDVHVGKVHWKGVVTIRRGIVVEVGGS